MKMFLLTYIVFLNLIKLVEFICFITPAIKVIVYYTYIFFSKMTVLLSCRSGSRGSDRKFKL